MKILASDFDNTLYVSDEDVLMKNVQSIKKFVSEGNLFCIVTGRSYTGIKVLLNKYSVPYNYLICEDGAKIFNNMDYAIYTKLIPKNKVILIKETIPNSYYYYLDDGYNKTENINDCVRVAIEYKNRDDALKLLDEIKNKVSVFGYLSSFHINITDCNVNKKMALKILCDLEELNINNLYVIGDDVNDLEMLNEFPSAIMSGHTDDLNDKKFIQYDSLYQYIEELSKN